MLRLISYSLKTPLLQRAFSPARNVGAVPTHVPSPPSWWAGRYGPFAGRAAGQVFRKKYSLPPHTHQRRESRGKNLFPLGFFPPFLPKKWGPGRAGQGSLPFQRRRRNPTTPPHPGSPRSRPFQQRREKPLPPPSPPKEGAFFLPFLGTFTPAVDFPSGFWYNG